MDLRNSVSPAPFAAVNQLQLQKEPPTSVCFWSIPTTTRKRKNSRTTSSRHLPKFVMNACIWQIRRIQISRMFFISLLRAMKIMGVETTPDCELFTAINQAYKWPASQFLSFPPEVYKLAQPESEEKIRDDEMKIKVNSFHSTPTQLYAIPLQETVNRDFLAWQGMHTPTFMDYMLEPLKQGRSPLTIFCVVHQVLCEDMRRGNDIRTMVYSILEIYQPKHIQMATNALVEYVIALMNMSTDKAEEDLVCLYEFHKNESRFLQIIRVLMQLVFDWQLLPFDRLLNSLVLHPVTDRQSQLALAIVSVCQCSLSLSLFLFSLIAIQSIPTIAGLLQRSVRASHESTQFLPAECAPAQRQQPRGVLPPPHRLPPQLPWVNLLGNEASNRGAQSDRPERAHAHLLWESDRATAAHHRLHSGQGTRVGHQRCVLRANHVHIQQALQISS